MARPATRSKNTTAHPGAVDAPSKRRTKAEVLADKEATDVAKRAKAEEMDQRNHRIAAVEMKMKMSYDKTEKSRVTHLYTGGRNTKPQPIQRTYSSHDLTEDDQNQVSLEVKKGLVEDDGSSLTGVDDTDEEVEKTPQQKGKGKGKKGVRQAINGLKSQQQNIKLKAGDDGRKAEQVKGGKPKPVEIKYFLSSLRLFLC